jgi:hypothetical protein
VGGEEERVRRREGRRKGEGYMYVYRVLQHPRSTSFCFLIVSISKSSFRDFDERFPTMYKVCLLMKSGPFYGLRIQIYFRVKMTSILIN